jgi:hypothetical protein
VNSFQLDEATTTQPEVPVIISKLNYEIDYFREYGKCMEKYDSRSKIFDDLESEKLLADFSRFQKRKRRIILHFSFCEIHGCWDETRVQINDFNGKCRLLKK